MTPDTNADVESASEQRPQRGRWRLTAWALLIAVVVVFIDQGTKAWAEATLSEHERIPLLRLLADGDPVTVQQLSVAAG